MSDYGLKAPQPSLLELEAKLLELEIRRIDEQREFMLQKLVIIKVQISVEKGELWQSSETTVTPTS